MSKNIECATLLLATYEGVLSNLNTSCTWNNINLRSVLGTMYDKYDIFNLELNAASHSYSQNIDIGLSPDDNNLLIQLSGLPLLNNTYNIVTKHNTNSTIIAPFEIIRNNVFYQVYANSSRVTFGKNSEQVNITINLLNYELAAPLAQNAYPMISYFFNIYGIPKDEDNLNNTRMIR
jgi:hypothetical protein